MSVPVIELLIVFNIYLFYIQKKLFLLFVVPIFIE